MRWLPLLTSSLLVLSACKDTGSEGPALSGRGLCADSCPKICESDSECDTPGGELCCDLGDYGQICTDADACPRFCSEDNQCDTADGDACIRPTLLASESICASTEAALTLCGDNADVCDSVGGEVCCENFTEPVCLPAGRCPASCSESSECGDENAICCTTASKIDPTISAPGLCLDGRFAACPKACESSAECAGSTGEICCNGLCQSSCPKECDTSSDCNRQLCCHARAIVSPWVRFAGEIRQSNGANQNVPRAEPTPAPGCDSTAFTDLGVPAECAECAADLCCAILQGESVNSEAANQCLELLCEDACR